jgi:amino acid adenylation domain-containing protein
MLLHDLLRRAAARAPEATALVEHDGATSYAELEAQANRVAHALIGRGIRRGDRVAIALENSRDMVAAYFGALKAGAVAVPLAAGARSDRVPAALADCTPAAAVTDNATLPLMLDRDAPRTIFVARTNTLPAAPEPGLSIIALDDALAAAPSSPPRVRTIDLDLAAIIYTSGSTGAPRGVMLSHLNLMSNARSIATYLKLTAADRVLAVLPFHYIYGLSLLHTHVLAGGSVVIENRFAFPNVALQTLQREAVTGFAGVPSTFSLLLHRSSVRTMRFPSLRYVTQAGGHMLPAQVDQWREAMPGVPFYVMYGATEAAARLAYLEPGLLSKKRGSIGRAIPNVELLVVREDGTVAAPGEVGEIVARGSNISPGYWNRPEETAQAFGPLGYRTGDLATADADGFLYIVGRKHDMLKVGGHRISANEIEARIAEHAAVADVAVVGAPHPLLGEAPVAFVAPRDAAPVSTAELAAFCRERMPEHKVPARFVIVRDLPRNASGKVDKRTLRDEVARAS